MSVLAFKDSLFQSFVQTCSILFLVFPILKNTYFVLEFTESCLFF